MKRITDFDEIKKLKWGEKIIRIIEGQSRSLRFVALMPGAPECYAIFCEGEYVTYLYVKRLETQIWLKGEYDSKIVGKYKLEFLNKRMESVKSIYFKEK